MFRNSLEQLLRRKLLLVALIASVAFLALYWWGVSSAEKAISSTPSSDPMMQALTPADSALAAIFTAGPMVAMLVTSLVIILGASILPDELAAGRMSLWTSLPQTRLQVFLGTTVSPLVAAIALGAFLFAGTALVTGHYFPFRPTSPLLVVIALPIWLMVPWASVTTFSLARRPGRVFTRDQLIEYAWKHSYYGVPKVVDVHVGHIRKKIEDDPKNPRLIVTVRGTGYRFEGQPS